ncbi:MAG: hypothetical protein KDA61_02100 [Planctomycetales bacterium]|nr:hypothetical protein [Planctomycetales bacterium]
MATQRGQQARDEKAREAAAKALSEEELKRLHASYRRELTDHVEACLEQLADNFPGFHYEAVMNEHGWGGQVRRDDLDLTQGRRDTLFSRLQLVVSPHNRYNVLSLAAKGAIRNKESFSRSHYQELQEVDLQTFKDLIEQWTLDYAEQFASAGA